MKKFKDYIKFFLRKLGYKLIKLNFKSPEAFPYHVPTLEGIKYLNESSGIFHFGGHLGMESAVYEWFGKKVVWVEALPSLFIELEDNIRKHYQQKAICAVLGDEDKKIVDFYVSNRDASSSIFDFSTDVKKNKIFKEINLKMNDVIKLEMRTLDSLLNEHKILAHEYNHWVVDLQGAELKFLKGATESLKHCQSINIEISKIEIYSGGVRFEELKKYLESKNFRLVEEPVGDHVDTLFIKNK